MVEHDVDDHLEPGSLQGRDAGTNLRPASRSEPRIGCAEGDGIVSPIIAEAEIGEMSFVDPGGRRHDLDGRDAELRQMRERGRMREARERAAQRLGHILVALTEAADVQLVEDRLRPGAALAAGSRAAWRRYDGLGNEARAVGLVERQIGHGVATAIAEHAAVQTKRPIEQQSLRIDEELARIEAMASGRLVGTVGAQAVAGALP
jgi:hypothetical protein